jgi:hypothetical protein
VVRKLSGGSTCHPSPSRYSETRLASPLVSVLLSTITVVSGIAPGAGTDGAVVVVVATGGDVAVGGVVPGGNEVVEGGLAADVGAPSGSDAPGSGASPKIPTSSSTTAAIAPTARSAGRSRARTARVWGGGVEEVMPS